MMPQRIGTDGRRSHIQLFQNRLAIRHPGMLVNHLSRVADQDDSRGRSYAIAFGNFFALRSKQIDSYDFSFTFQFFFDPIHDGSGCQSTGSRILEKFDQNRAASSKLGIKLSDRFQSGCFISKYKPQQAGDSKQYDDRY